MLLKNHGEIEDITLFLLPMVMKNDSNYEDIPKPIIKTCISIFDRPELDDRIILVSSHNMEIQKRRKDVYYKHLYDESNEKHYYVFDVAIKDEEDLYKIVTGKYSELSISYKQKLLDFWGQKQNTQLFNILCKNWTYRKISVPDLIYGYRG